MYKLLFISLLITKYIFSAEPRNVGESKMNKNIIIEAIFMVPKLFIRRISTLMIGYKVLTILKHITSLYFVITECGWKYHIIHL